MISWIRRLSTISIVFVLLVILAGSVVRSTGSGMGCPDWPKCFGYTIPPTSEDQVRWAANRTFEPGHMIIQGEELLVAQSEFQSGEAFDPSNWSVYEKHDYALFNVVHTWIEFINRLLGGASGIPITLLFVTCLIYWIRKKKPGFFLLSGTAMLVLLGVALLGKMVVDGNLEAGQITLHMSGSLLLLGLLVLIRRKAGRINYARSNVGFHHVLLLAAIVLSIVQIFMGTQVREEVDLLLKEGVAREGWIDALPLIFKFHRSFSILVVALNAYLLWVALKQGLGWSLQVWVMVVILLEVIGGVVLAYAGMPAAFQPVHLMFAVILLAIQLSQFYLVFGKSWVKRRNSMIA